MSEIAVRITNLSKKFNRTVALDNVSLDIPANTLYGMLGPNGAGKTTLFGVAAGFLKATSGEIEVHGINVKNISALRGRMSMLPQDASFQSGIPVIEQLTLFARLNGFDAPAAAKAAAEALDLVGLPDVAKKNARALSHGMLKRVALCQAFIGHAEVIFLDEPTAGLDPDNARRIRDLVKAYKKDRTIIFSSHNLQEVQQICDHVCILHKGRVMECGTMDELTSASFLLRVTLDRALGLAAEGELTAHPLVAGVIREDDLSFQMKLNLQNSSQKTDAMKMLYDVLGRHGLFPRSVNEGASLEARFLEITGGKFDGGSSS
ncbi:MAG: ABC transporter ATP-binding protein [Verrucomicrobia bacterium]|nr:ABC transporter ATP-binding protein [Verrucomicrobiota bacterium]